MKRIRIFDTTLRDGEQAGHPMNAKEKLALALMAEKAGVNVLEAGFAESSPEELKAIQLISRQVRGISVCSLSRAIPASIDKAWEAVKDAVHPQIHTFVATSDVHVRDKLRKSKSEVLAMVKKAVAYAKNYCPDVEFSPEDASRTSPEYLANVVKAAIKAGATTINIPDTVGYATPWEFGELIGFVYQKAPALHDVVLSIHCHNDLGLATVNTLAGVKAGARQIEGCWIGIGERAGNAALEEVIMALKTRRDFFGVDVDFDTKQIGPICRALSNIINYEIPGHKAVSGSLAHAHSSGVHRDGVDKNPQTYEIFTREDVGGEGESLLLTARIGKNGLRKHLDQFGFNGAALIEQVYPAFIEMAERVGKLGDDDLRGITQEILVKRQITAEKLFDLAVGPDDFNYGPRTGAVKIRRNGREVARWANGDGPIDALFTAIQQAITELGENLSLRPDQIKWKPVQGKGGQAAIAWVTITITDGNRVASGRSGDTDTIKASAKALVYAINNLLHVPASLADN